MRTSKFKVGDRVRVVHNFASLGMEGEKMLGGTGHVVGIMRLPNHVTGYYPGVWFRLEGKHYPEDGFPGDAAIEAELELKP